MRLQNAMCKMFRKGKVVCLCLESCPSSSQRAKDFDGTEKQPTSFPQIEPFFITQEIGALDFTIMLKNSKLRRHLPFQQNINFYCTFYRASFRHTAEDSARYPDGLRRRSEGRELSLLQWKQRDYQKHRCMFHTL